MARNSVFFFDFGFSCDATSPKQGLCQRNGLICSDDCTKIMYCLGEGAEPDPYPDCSTEDNGRYQYCQRDTDFWARCSTNEPVCNRSFLYEDVRCTEFGEFPHPTQCETTIRCDGNLAQPKELCYCVDGEPNLSLPGLPCVPAQGCARDIVKCNSPGQMGRIPGSEDFCYTCVDNSILVYYCNNSILKEKSSSFPKTIFATSYKNCHSTL